MSEPKVPTPDVAALVRELEERTRELERVNRELGARESRLRAIFDAEPECIKLVARDGRLLEMNPAGLAMIEAASFAEVDRASILDVIAPEHRVPFRELVEANFRGETRQLEFEIVGLRGTRRWMQTHAIPLRDAGGRVIASLGVTRDVTAARSTERALRESSEWLRLAIKASGIGFWNWDLDTNEVVFSVEWKKQIGYEDDEIGNAFTEWESRVHPEDLPSALAAVQGYLAHPVGSYETEFRLKHRDGSWRWIHTRAEAVRDAAGKPARVLGCHIDVTERRQAEEALRRERDLTNRVVDSLPGIYYLFDRDGRYLNWNRNLELLGGYSTEEMRERHPLDFFRGEDRERVLERIGEVFTRGEAEVEADFITRDGRAIPHYFTGRLIEIDGEPCLIGMGIDITARREAEASRQALEMQLRQAQKLEAIGTMAGGIAHDFNNILAAIVGNAELAALDVASESPAGESVTEILAAARRGKELVQRILTFSRPRDQQLAPVCLAEVVAEAARLVRSTLPSRVALEVRQSDAVPAVRADASQMHQVVVNLVNNAAHALADGSGRIDIALDPCTLTEDDLPHPELSSGEWVCLTVRDTGSGMDAATRERIFEPFFTTKPPGEGSGLGLPVVHGIVRNHGGAITVDSAPGRGTTVRVFLPAADGLVPEPAHASRTAAAPGQGEHILYLDDEAPLVSLAQRVLTRLGYRVTGLTAVEDALEQFAQDPHAFDLVITDLSMPGKSGMEVAREMLARRPGLPVLLTSGRVSPDDATAARALGVREIILKPNSLDELGPLVRRVLAAR